MSEYFGVDQLNDDDEIMAEATPGVFILAKRAGQIVLDREFETFERQFDDKPKQ